MGKINAGDSRQATIPEQLLSKLLWCIFNHICRPLGNPNSFSYILDLMPLLNCVIHLFFFQDTEVEAIPKARRGLRCWDHSWGDEREAQASLLGKSQCFRGWFSEIPVGPLFMQTCHAFKRNTLVSRNVNVL